jgi:hypothetical protein
MLNVVMLVVITLSVALLCTINLHVITLNISILCVIMLSLEAV